MESRVRREEHAQDVLGDAERGARAGELRSVDVRVDPRRRPYPVGVLSEGKKPDVAALGRPRERSQPRESGEGRCPRVELCGELVVAEIALAEAAGERV
jgi:hypothetical protein